MADLPTGTVTLLFTDIEHSTQLLQRLGRRYADVLAEYRQLLRAIFQQHGGHEVDTQGDSFFVAFPRAIDAVAAAVAIQRALAAHPWPEGVTLATRMGLHTGEPQRGHEGYVGLDVHRAARIGTAGHGGQVLLSEATRALVAHDLPAGITLRDLGLHRLKDLRYPRHIFQVIVPELPSDFPPLKTLESRPNNLPLQSTSFIGRDPEVTALRQRLREPGVRLLTLTGPGGTGKTRLALQIAAELLNHFRDGVFFVDLAPITDPTLVAVAIARILGVTEVSGQPLVATLTAYLREQHLLLVLDNFEQVMMAAPLVADLLAAAATLKMLVTSRAPLHLRGEREIVVSPLLVPDLASLPAPEALLDVAAIRLFVERAQDAKADFVLTAANAAAVAEICVRLDGLPLAIELAAARSKVLPPAALLARLRPESPHRFALLTGGPRDLPGRQQTLRATIAWSYDLLDAQEQILLRRLAVFTGGRSFEAIAAICMDDLTLDVLDGITSLVDKSLVREVESVAGQPRFVLLETIHAYARERLEDSGEGDRLHRKHLHYFRDLAEEAEPQIFSHAQVVWLNRLEEEHNNFRAALAWSLTDQAWEDGVRLAAALFGFWHMHVHFREGYTWYQRLLVYRGSVPSIALVQALIGAGNLAWLCDVLEQAIAYAEEGVALARQLGDRLTLVSALCQLSFITPNPARKLELADEACALARLADDPRWQVWAFIAVGIAQRLQGNIHAAEAAFQAGLALNQHRGDAFTAYHLLSRLARIAVWRGDYDRAEALSAASSSASAAIGHASGATELVWGAVAYYRGDLERAATLLDESLARFRRTGHRFETALVLAFLARIALARDDSRSARAWSAESLAIAQEVRDDESIAAARYITARLAHRDGKLEEAIQLCQASLTTAGAYGLVRDVRVEVLEELASLAGAGSAGTRAARLWGAAAAAWDVLDMPLPPIARAEYDRDVAIARSQMDDATWQAAWAEGQAMTLEQAIAYALEEPPDA